MSSNPDLATGTGATAVDPAASAGAEPTPAGSINLVANSNTTTGSAPLGQEPPTFRKMTAIAGTLSGVVAMVWAFAFAFWAERTWTRTAQALTTVVVTFLLVLLFPIIHKVVVDVSHWSISHVVAASLLWGGIFAAAAVLIGNVTSLSHYGAWEFVVMFVVWAGGGLYAATVLYALERSLYAEGAAKWGWRSYLIGALAGAATAIILINVYWEEFRGKWTSAHSFGALAAGHLAWALAFGLSAMLVNQAIEFYATIRDVLKSEKNTDKSALQIFAQILVLVASALVVGIMVSTYWGQTGTSKAIAVVLGALFGGIFGLVKWAWMKICFNNAAEPIGKIVGVGLLAFAIATATAFLTFSKLYERTSEDDRLNEAVHAVMIAQDDYLAAVTANAADNFASTGDVRYRDATSAMEKVKISTRPTTFADLDRNAELFRTEASRVTDCLPKKDRGRDWTKQLTPPIQPSFTELGEAALLGRKRYVGPAMIAGSCTFGADYATLLAGILGLLVGLKYRPKEPKPEKPTGFYGPT